MATDVKDNDTGFDLAEHRRDDLRRLRISTWSAR